MRMQKMSIMVIFVHFIQYPYREFINEMFIGLDNAKSFASWNDSIRDFVDIFVIIPWHYPKIHTLFFSATIRCQSSINEHIESGDAVYAMKCFWVNTWTSGDEEGGGLSISSFNWNSILYEFWRWNLRFRWGLWVLGHLCFWYWMNASYANLKAQICGLGNARFMWKLI